MGISDFWGIEKVWWRRKKHSKSSVVAAVRSKDVEIVFEFLCLEFKDSKIQIVEERVIHTFDLYEMSKGIG